MKKKMSLNENQKTLLEMLYDLSSGKGYLYLEQLVRLALHFNIYKTESAVRMSIREMISGRTIEYQSSGANPKVGYKIVVLTPLGFLMIGRETKKAIFVKPNTLDLNTRRAEYVMSMFNPTFKYQDIKNQLSYDLSTLLHCTMVDACKFSEFLIQRNRSEDLRSIRDKNETAARDYQAELHQEYVEFLKGRLYGNLVPDKKIKPQCYVENVFDLGKKYIYISKVLIVEEGKEGEEKTFFRPEFVRIVPGRSRYSGGKLVEDMEYVRSLSLALFGTNDYSYCVVFQNLAGAEYLEDSIEDLLEEFSGNAIKVLDVERARERYWYTIVDIDKYSGLVTGPHKTKKEDTEEYSEE